MDEKSKNAKVVYLPHNHTPEMQKLFLKGVALLNEVISEFELKRREAEKNKPAAGQGGDAIA